jgi:hypothetical protein
MNYKNDNRDTIYALSLTLKMFGLAILLFILKYLFIAFLIIGLIVEAYYMIKESFK